MSKSEIMQEIERLERERFGAMMGDKLTEGDKKFIAAADSKIAKLQRELEECTESMRDSVNNVPEYASNYPFWVVRDVEGELWFYGAYETKDRAESVAHTVHGLVVSEED